MVLVNPAVKEVVVKIVYYGPGLGGKTTNLRYIYENIEPSTRGKMISLSTEGDRTLFFDFLPIKIGELGGYKVRIQLYTVPGQVFYEATRKIVLNGADGVVFVADSQKHVFESNLESLESLKNNLREKGIRFEEIPLVFQFNKRDLKDIHDIEFLNKELNEMKRSFFPAIAIRGNGVMETFKRISEMVIKNVAKRIDKDGSLRTVPIFNVQSVPSQEKAPSEIITAGENLLKANPPLQIGPFNEKTIETLTPLEDKTIFEEDKKEIKIPIEIELKGKESEKFEIKIVVTVKRKD
ncbi:MAG: GTP-binding protein [Candidatus Aminicenantia bacterium]